MSEKPASPISNLLHEGIDAVKARDFEKARRLLTQVVEQDEHNEQAWLWLSGAVDTDEDRRICLENVLAINPSNTAARHGLDKLGPAPAQPQPETQPREHVVRREVAPVSLAQALLYPEAQVKEWRWTDPTAPLKATPTLETRSASSFDDVWNTSKDLCAYCAQEVAEEDRLCPRCQRNLIETQLRYPQPSANLYYLGVLTLSLGLQFLLQLGLDISLRASLPIIVFDGLLTLALLAFALGVYARKRWGYLGAIVTSGLALFVSLIRITTGVTARNELVAVIGLLLPAAHTITSLLNVLLGILRAGPDFETVETRLVARLGETLRLTGDLYHTGKHYADKGMWAKAVPYWQRAAAADPGRIFYQQALGEAYARLSFYERSLDMFDAALQAASDPATRAEIERLANEVRQRIDNE